MDFTQIIALVKEAGNLVFSKELKSSVNMKGEADFVTAVDLAISDFIKKKLKILTPDCGFVSEEGNCEESKKRWILDPIDGTTNLVYDYRMCSVSLALCEGDKITFGVVYNPFNGDLFTAERGKGAYYNGEKLKKAPDRDLKDCLIEFGAGSTRKAQADQAFALARDIFKNCLDIRRICSSALAICYVAAGRLNGYFESKLKPWDYAAASLILEECGGSSLDWNGNPVEYENPSSFVCGTPKALKFLLEKIKEYM